MIGCFILDGKILNISESYYSWIIDEENINIDSNTVTICGCDSDEQLNRRFHEFMNLGASLRIYRCSSRNEFNLNRNRIFNSPEYEFFNITSITRTRNTGRYITYSNADYTFNFSPSKENMEKISVLIDEILKESIS